MALVDRTQAEDQGFDLAKRIGRSLKALLGKIVYWRAHQFDLSELTDAQCRDAGINPVDLEAARVRRSDLIK